MKNFKPSEGFTVRIMQKIYSYEKGKDIEYPFPLNVIPSLFLKYALCVGSTLIGILNIARFYFAVLAPSVCW